jgi:hypothetical protein
MSAFATYWQRKMRRCERSTFLGEVCTNFDKRLTVRIVDARLAFWSWVLRLLKATKQFLGRLAAKPASPG